MNSILPNIGTQERRGSMSMKTVLILMAISGSILAGYSLSLHEYLIAADEAEVQRTCRHLCRLKLTSVTGSSDGVLGQLTEVMVGAACENLEDEAPELTGCRERLLGQQITVSEYRCVMRARTKIESSACGDGIQ
jgi:hypothetical protein